MSNTTQLYGFGYNVNSRKWGQLLSPVYAYQPVPVDATSGEIRSFGFTFYSMARFLCLKAPYATGVFKLFGYGYPYKTTTQSEAHGAGSMTTGVLGEHGKSVRSARVFWHTTYDDEAVNGSQVATVGAYGYKNSAKTFVAYNNKQGTINATLDCGDILASAPFIDITLTTPTTIPCEFLGIGIEVKQQGMQ